jgi:hypothetical protein
MHARAQGNAIGSIFYTPGNFFNPTLIGEAITGMPAGRKLSQFVKSPGADGNPDPYGFTKGVSPSLFRMSCLHHRVLGLTQLEVIAESCPKLDACCPSTLWRQSLLEPASAWQAVLCRLGCEGRVAAARRGEACCGS